MAELHFIELIHRQTPRDYLGRVVAGKKAEYSARAKKFDFDYWDGDRNTGYGGHHYDGRWVPFAEKLIAHYGLKAGQRVLDVGCGKGFLLYDLKTLVPDLQVSGLEISTYAIQNSKPEIKSELVQGFAHDLSRYPDQSFDLVLAINSLHNQELPELVASLKELQRVARGAASYLVVDSYRNPAEKANLMNWQLTCECFFTPREWEYLYTETAYQGDWDYVIFE
jgi:ubiquinone/menaquinone biosynthesis C-methylase UbiE